MFRFLGALLSVACLVGCCFLIGCANPVTTKIEQGHVEGMELYYIADSDKPVYIKASDLMVGKHYNVWLRGNAKTYSEPPTDGMVSPGTKCRDIDKCGFVQVYRSEGKFYVISYGVQSFFVNDNTWDRHLPIEKIVVIPDRKRWRHESFADAFKDKEDTRLVISD